MPAVEGKQRHQIEDEQGDVERTENRQQARDAVQDRRVGRGDLARQAPRADDRQRTVRVAALSREKVDGGVVDAHRQLPDDPRDLAGLRERGLRAVPQGLTHVFDARRHTDEADLGRLRGAVRPRDLTLGEHRGDLQRLLGPVSPHDDGEGSVRRGLNDRGCLGEGLHGRAVDRDDHVSRAKARRCGGRSGVVGGAGGLGGARRQHALVDRGDRGRGGLQPDAAEHDGEQHHRKQEVHHRPAEHDDDPLVDRQLVEGVLSVVAVESLIVDGARVLHHGGEESAAGFPVGGCSGGGSVGRGRGRVHARHRDVAPERNGLDTVFGLADAARPQRAAETDHVLTHAHPEALGGDEVTEFVQGDRHREPDDEQRDPDDESDDGHNRRRYRAPL